MEIFSDGSVKYPPPEDKEKSGEAAVEKKPAALM
jgi:hypothetical protein